MMNPLFRTKYFSRIFYTLVLCFSAMYAGIVQAADLQFSLAGPDNKVYKAEDFKDKYLLIAVGFTSCPDICPTTLLEFREALKILGPLTERLQPLFITIDPLRDDPERLNQYTHYFDPRIMGLRGDLEETADVAKQLKAKYGYLYENKEVYPPDLPHGYTVYHSTYIYLFSPELKLVDVFNYNQGGQALADGIKPYLEAQ